MLLTRAFTIQYPSGATMQNPIGSAKEILGTTAKSAYPDISRQTGPTQQTEKNSKTQLQTPVACKPLANPRCRSIRRSAQKE